MKKVSIFIFVLLCIAGYLYIFFPHNKDVLTHLGPKESVRIGNVGEHSLLNLVAKSNGYFAQNGLDARVIEYASGPAAVSDLLAGKVDIANAADFVGVSTIFTNPEIRILSQTSRHTIFQVIGRKDKGIMRPTDLKGKRIGVTEKGVGEFFLGRFLLFNGLSIHEVQMVNLTPSDIEQQIENGQIDAAVIFDPHAYIIKKVLGNSVISWSAQGDQKVFAMLYGTESFVKNHPDAVVRYLRALLEAEQYIHLNPDGAKKILEESMHYSPAYVAYMWPNFQFALGLDQDLLLSMEDQAQFVIDSSLTDKTTVPNYLDYIDFAGLEQVKPDGITIIK